MNWALWTGQDADQERLDKFADESKPAPGEYRLLVDGDQLVLAIGTKDVTKLYKAKVEAWGLRYGAVAAGEDEEE